MKNDLRAEAQRLTVQGYMILGQQEKKLPPKGATGRDAEWKNEYVGDEHPNFLSVRYDDSSFGLDLDTDPAAGHAAGAGDTHALWTEFVDTFDVTPVRTGANTDNDAGIYHFQMGEGVTEDDVARIRVPSLDVIRKGHRFAVVRGTHPKTAKPYAGELPRRADLPVFTAEMLAWWLERSSVKSRTTSAVEPVDMPTPVPVTDSERKRLDFLDSSLTDRDWSQVGGRKRLLFGAAQRAARNLTGTPVERMGKALSYVAPYVDEARAHSGRDKQQRYASVGHFWQDNAAGLTECLQSLAQQVDDDELVSLASEMLHFHKRFVHHRDEHWHNVIVLWSMHTYAMESWRRTPRLYITAPEKNCGKSVQGQLVQVLSKDAMKTESITAAAMFRYVEKNRPTLIIDEVDTLWSSQNPNNEEMRAMINAGHEMDGTVIRCKPKTFEPEQFSVFAPVALVGIDNSRMPDTILSRSVKVVMTRNDGGAQVEDFDPYDHKDFSERLSILDGLSQALGRNPKPDSAQHLNNRSRDVWTPLYAIAELLGDEWVEAVDAASRQQPEESESWQTGILRLAKEYFAAFDVDRVSASNLRLYVIEQGELANFSTKGLANVLRGYGVVARRTREGSVYHRADFEQAFKTYLPVADSVADEPICNTESAANSGLVADVADVADAQGSNTGTCFSSGKNPSPDIYRLEEGTESEEAIVTCLSATSATSATGEDDWS
ncbi:DUF3631 domain-containing protein [Serinicoccus sp. LYQ131]|uniref:DUF3631 domain-containing protein n=1 Tax=Serinicoccus sp. LYQ131 TaxID=3378797 RepID=UPI003854EB74